MLKIRTNVVEKIKETTHNKEQLLNNLSIVKVITYVMLVFSFLRLSC